MLKNANENSPKSQLLTVQQAAEYLGVHAATIRRWAYAKLLKGTKMGIRGDWRFAENDLEKMAKSNYLTNTAEYSEVSLTPYAEWNMLNHRSHFVQFYEDDAYLLTSIRKYIDTGDAAVVIATPSHREYLEDAMRQENSGKPNKKYIFLDASETLSKFMVNRIPDLKLFESVVGRLIEDLSKTHKNIRAYGEMVAILWANGNKEGAIRLEEFWNLLQKRLTFTLYCAYPMQDIGGSEAANAFSDVCITHSDVLPTERYTSLTTDDERLREIAILQQKAQALEAEIVKRSEAEKSLLETVKQLKHSEEFNRNIVESSADCIKILDLNARLLSFNGPGCKIMEIDDVSQFIGKDWLSFWTGEYYDDANTAFETAKNGGVGRFQGSCPTAKGTPKWWDVMVTPIFDDSGNVQNLVSVSRDITAIKELEQRKDDFLSATSHELKTPLTSQKAYIQLLQKLIEKNKEVKYARFVTKVSEQTDKLTRLVNELLDISKIQGGKLILNKTFFDMNALVKESVEEIQATSNRQLISVKGKISKEVYADKEKISQVIINLLINAAKYSSNANKINVTVESKGNDAIVCVQDFGIGIDKKDVDKIFDRFYQARSGAVQTYPGLGLGLYISKEIIELHKGKIWVESIPGKGSTFYFSLPLSNK